MELGTFSISLAVKEIEASRKFYEKFGFKVFAGDASQNWLILKNRHLSLVRVGEPQLVTRALKSIISAGMRFKRLPILLLR